MSTPYVSHRRLIQNSMAAMLSAIEIYNKPMMTYRDEVTVMLIVNAWELALKAALRKSDVRIFYPKKRYEDYRSFALDTALSKVTGKHLWPDDVDGVGVTANLKALADYRDRAIHLYNIEGLGALMYPFLQQNVLNYRDFVLKIFKKDLADSMTWQLLPLGATAPSESVQFMKPGSDRTALAEVKQFLDGLRQYMDDAEAAGGDMARVATVYDIHMRSVKKMTSADLTVAVSPTADGQIIVKRADPNQTHPFTMTELLAKVNAKRNGRKVTSHDHQAVCWKEGLRNDPRYAWKHSNALSPVWSGDAVSHLAGLSDDYYDQVRVAYQSRERQNG
ncbi:DUF3644 domain-containing protein [Nocardioides sp. YIM B13467]|uniref:DUF3644 domain-containing protein n=1 Tax=Nocardioides sp. YIM B13467 TaxID=3366294 RepID=UPI00366B4A2A